MTVTIDAVTRLDAPKSLRFNILVSHGTPGDYIVIAGICVRKGRLVGAAQKAGKGYVQNPLIGPVLAEAIFKEFKRSERTAKYADWIFDDMEQATLWLRASKAALVGALPNHEIGGDEHAQGA